MKKFLLTAGSIVAFAVSSSALDVSLGGEVSTRIEFQNGNFYGPHINWYGEDYVLLKAAGEGAGWNYGVSLDLLSGGMHDATVTLGHSGLGQFEFQDYGMMTWSREFLGDMLGVQIEFDPSNIENFAANFYGAIGATEYDVLVYNDPSRSFSAELQFPVMGVNVGTYILGQLSDTSDVSYGLELGTNIAGVDLIVAFDEAVNIEVEAQLGAFGLKTNASDGDFFNELTLEYAQEITENLEFQATVGMNGSEPTGSATMYLRF